MAYDPLDYLMRQSNAGVNAQDFGSPFQAQKTVDPISAAIGQKPVRTNFATNTQPVASQNGVFKFGPRAFSRTMSDQSDLLQQVEETFYGGGNAPPTPSPTPTPTPGTRNRQLSQWGNLYGWGS